MRRKARLVDTVDFEEVLEFPPSDEIRHGSLFSLSLSSRTADFTHGLHRFPAKFVPQIPDWAIRNFAAPGATVLDPFMGSGTSLVEGLRHGVQAIGVDIDPLARLIARAKTTSVDPQRLRALGDELRVRWNQPASTLVAPMPDIHNFEHWYRKQQWGWLQSLRECIQSLECSTEEREFLLVIMSSILRVVSNADDQSQKTYVSGTLHKTPAEVRTAFWRSYDRALSGLLALSCARAQGASVWVVDDGDATYLPLADESVDLVVTSPPYLDSVDYPYNMMLEYFWLGSDLGIADRRAFNELRRRQLGSRNPDQDRSLPNALTSIFPMESVPVARQRAIQRYFSLMEDHFREASRCLKHGSRYVMVVGNSQSRGGSLPVHQALVLLASTFGLKLEKAFAYRIRRHYMKFPRAGRGGIIVLDWVLVLRKDPCFSAAPVPASPWVTLRPEAVAH